MEIINNYVQNNYTTIFSNEMLYQIINNYITLNKTTVINETILFEVISNYFKVNYNLFIDETFIQQIINNYIIEHQTTIIDIDIVRTVVNNYVKQNITTIFDVNILNQIFINYFEQNTTIFQQIFSEYSGIIKSVTVEGDRCIVTLKNETTIELAVYDAYARIRDRVQSIVVVPKSNGHVTFSGSDYMTLSYMVTPAAMANIIVDKFSRDEMAVEFLVLDSKGEIYVGKPDYDDVSVSSIGVINVKVPRSNSITIKSIALCVKENITGGTDYITSFTPVDY
jgi:hypothetical protein